MIPYIHVFCSFLQRKERGGMQIYQTYLSLMPAGILNSSCTILEELTRQARRLHYLTFSQKLSRILTLCSGAMQNAHEQQMICTRTFDPFAHLMHMPPADPFERLMQNEASSRYYFFKDNIANNPRLSYALEKRVGSDAHHSVLFFILGFHAELGSPHYIHFAQNPRGVQPQVYNEICDPETAQLHNIHVFQKTIEDELDRFRPGLINLSERKLEFVKGALCFSYHRCGEEYVIAEEYERHVRRILK